MPIRVALLDGFVEEAKEPTAWWYGGGGGGGGGGVDSFDDLIMFLKN